MVEGDMATVRHYHVNFNAITGVGPPVELAKVATDGSVIGFRRAKLRGPNEATTFRWFWFAPSGTRQTEPAETRAVTHHLHQRQPDDLGDPPPRWPAGSPVRSQRARDGYFVEVVAPIGQHQLHYVTESSEELLVPRLGNDDRVEAIGAGCALRFDTKGRLCIHRPGEAELRGGPLEVALRIRQAAWGGDRVMYYLPEPDVVVWVGTKEAFWLDAGPLREVTKGDSLGIARGVHEFKAVRRRAKKTKKKKKKAVLSAKDQRRLATVQAAGLLNALDEAFLEEIAHLVAGGEDRLATAIDLLHLYGKPRDVLVRSPQSVRDAKGTSVSDVLKEDSRGELVLTGPSGTEERRRCATYADWAEAFNAALEVLGDDRRYVHLVGPDWEEPLFILCGPEGQAALAEASLVDTGY